MTNKELCSFVFKLGLFIIVTFSFISAYSNYDLPCQNLVKDLLVVVKNFIGC